MIIKLFFASGPNKFLIWNGRFHYMKIPELARGNVIKGSLETIAILTKEHLHG
jgi:hypothetical protein